MRWGRDRSGATAIEYGLVAGALALAAFFSSIIVAARLDQPRRASLGDVLGALRAHALDILLFAGIISIAGALIWVLAIVYAGYFFDNLPMARNNLTVVIFGIIGLSLMPLVAQYVRSRRAWA